MRALLVFLVVLVPTLCSAETAYAKEKQVVFERGARAASVQGTVIRGQVDNLTLHAKEGQTMTVSISAAERNAVFQIYAPGYSIRHENGAQEVTGQSLPKAGEADDTTTWSGKLPKTGQYLIVVGGTRGNATYKLNVEVN